MITDQLLISRQTGKVRTRPLLWGPVSPHAARGAYFMANSFSNNSSESLAPSSDNHTDLFFVAGFEI